MARSLPQIRCFSAHTVFHAIYNNFLALALHSRTATTPHVRSFQWLQAQNSFVDYRQTPPPTASSSSLTHRRTTGIRHARDSMMQSPSQSPRRRRLEHAGIPSPLRDASNCLHYPPAENPNAGSSSEQEHAELRELQRERHAALQETPSRRRRRIPGQTENRVPSPTPGPSQARQQQVWGSPNYFYGP
jgi:hypothetical protein